MEIGHKHTQSHEQLLGAISKLSGSKTGAEDAALLGGFQEATLSHFPVSDWLGRPLKDLHAFTVDFLQFAKLRQEECLVKVFNPSLEANGWICGRSVVLVCCKDKPFLVDSIRIVLEDAGYAIHISKSTVATTERSAEGELQSLKLAESNSDASLNETFAYFEITGIASEDERKELKAAINEALCHVTTVVNDYRKMVGALEDLTSSLEKQSSHEEALAFLRWLRSSHFTFLGYRSFDFDRSSGGEGLDAFTMKEDVSQRLGIFKAVECEAVCMDSAHFPAGAKAFYASDEAICFSKSGTRSTVHRNVYPDYVVIKRFDNNGQVIGEVRFMGFFTYAVSSMSPADIPILRNKVTQILEEFGLNPKSHDGKRLGRVIDLHPKEELFQCTASELCNTFKTIVDLNERDIVRFIARKDPFGQFVSSLIFVPKDLYTTNLRIKIQSLIAEELGAESADVTTFFSESKHARAHIIFKLPQQDTSKSDLSLLEPEIVELALGWMQHFRKALDEKHGESRGSALFKLYQSAFPQSYQEASDARATVSDISTFESLSDDKRIAMRLYQPVDCKGNELRFRVAHANNMLELSDVIPILEDLGLRVLGDQPFKIVRADGAVFWLHDFKLLFDAADSLSVDAVRVCFEDAFEKAWHKDIESDAFNKLILTAGLNWKQVNLIRAYANYMKQTMFQISLQYIAETLTNYPDLVTDLVKLFALRFDPSTNKTVAERLNESGELSQAIEAKFEGIKILNQDKVMRRYLELINGTLRVNFYQDQAGAVSTPYLSIKFEPSKISDIPEPRPAFEFFVYSSRVEGVHLRTSKVARGGLRWSDRKEDYRTEVLGLVKAQQVKNAVIVPSGAKGGFVAKQLSNSMNRDEFFAEGVECYKIFIRGLLDLTDNLVGESVSKPVDVVCLDDDDPYLVVAADKGTATFSDIANTISIEKGHWLGDAFASGGSQGYDHKGMGITAKGAWVSVQRHFRELNIDTQKDEFTVIGIGDMAGDVFGNGMLLSKTIKLVAAFNHMHIFIDPDPSAEESFVERQRLFTTPGTSWEDYDTSLISQGGGIFNRAEKFIDLSSEIQQLIGSEEKRLTPTDLINRLLKSQVDLIWNGGIGTYVKSSDEQHADVGDKANDCLRVNGSELNCRVFGEGGNLGLTQKGRIEYGLNGGKCNTDFIDNAAGVDCSDHEVNIKILVDGQQASGDLTEKQRNQLLVDMTDAVSDLVLKNNYHQTQALSIAEHQVTIRMNEYRRFISYLEDQGRLDRALEFLPHDADIVERIGRSQPLSRPELSVLISYAKVQLKEELANSEIGEDAFCARSLYHVFPDVLCERYQPQINSHKLRKEIIATELANQFINSLGITALHRLSETTGASSSEIVKAYVAASEVFKFQDFVASISDLDYSIASAEQYELISSMTRKVRRGTRWFLKNRRAGLNVESEVEIFQCRLKEVQVEIGKLINETEKQERDSKAQVYSELGIAEEWVDVLLMPDNLFSGLGVVEVSNVTQLPVDMCSEMFFELLRRLKLDWFASQLSEIKVENYWQANARESYIDDLESQLRKLSVELLKIQPENTSASDFVGQWSEDQKALIDRWTAMVNKVEGTSKSDYAMFAVALKELNDLVQVVTHQ